MLEPARKAVAPAPLVPKPAPAVAPSPVRPVESSPVENRPVLTAPPIVPPPSQPKPEPVPAPAAAQPAVVIGGPSLLGLDQPDADVLRDRAFSNLGAYGQEEQRSKGGRILLLLLLLAALGGGYWWTYTNYLKVAVNRKPEVSNPGAAKNAAADSSTGIPPIQNEQLPVRTEPRVVPPVIAPEPPPQKAAKRESAATAAPAPVEPRHEVTASRLPATPAPADDSGETLFRRGERLLYGRGGEQDCTNAMKYLKLASDKQNAKARSAIGTMYATGHCVSRDLPSAYHWFALALRADPNNSVVEKNLSAVWNQMTPPERQLATKTGSQ